MEESLGAQFYKADDHDGAYNHQSPEHTKMHSYIHNDNYTIAIYH